jgi:hypothetical protein
MTPDPKTLEMLSAYLDEALSSREMAAVKNLLAKDADLRDALKRLKSLRTGLKSLPTLTPPESFYDRVWRDVGRTPTRRPFFSYFPYKTIAALAVVSLVVVATKDFWRPAGNRRMSLSPLQMFQSSLKAGQAASPAMALEIGSAERKDKALVPPASRLANIEMEANREVVPALKPGEVARQVTAAPAGAISVGAAGGPAQFQNRAASPIQGDLPIFSKLRGATSGVKDPRTVVARSEAEWNELWSRHAPGRPVPRLDFSRVMVAAVFMGQKPTSGYAVEIQKVQNNSGRIRVLYHITEPAPRAAVAQTPASPFHIVVLPRVEGDVQFEPN